MGKKLFGTDGIRGVAGEPPLDAKTVFAVGVSLGTHLRKDSPVPRVIIGEDPRESSRWIAESVAAGLQSSGAKISYAGVVTTPAIAFLSKRDSFDAGIMISASHNPFMDNGIKVFATSGYKLPDADEKHVEDLIFSTLAQSNSPQPTRVDLKSDQTLSGEYIEHLRGTWSNGNKFSGGHVIIDCSNGSASAFADDVLSGLGLTLKIVANQPDGKNINLGCGSLHMEKLQKMVVEEKAELGIAFDGDADRALFIDGRGEMVNGDGVLLAAARFMKRQGTLKGESVVGTVMSNLGLEVALRREGLKLLRTQVGDKYVLEEMLRSGCNLGGEQSGHIIFSDVATTGDGLLTALRLLNIMAAEGKPLAQLVDGLKNFPQTIRNIKVRERIPFENVPSVMDEIRSSEERLGNSGRVVVRYSGTELLARVMVEAETPEAVEQNASAISNAIQQTIGIF